MSNLENFLDLIPLWLILSGSFALMIFGVELGFRFGSHWPGKESKAQPAQGRALMGAGLGLAALLLAACATKPVEKNQTGSISLQIAGIEIHNGLTYSIQDVIIKVPLTGDFVSCGEILPESSCSTSFPLRDYQGNKVQVSWKEQGQAHSTTEFQLTPPDAAVPGQLAYIRVEVFAAGQAGAKLILLEGDGS